MNKFKPEKRILIIEDNDILAKALSDYIYDVLEDKFYLFINIIHDLKQINGLDLNSYDLIIADCHLPTGNFCNDYLLSSIKVPTLIISGYLSYKDLLYIEKKYKNIKVLRKPFFLDVFKNMVKDLIENNYHIKNYQERREMYAQSKIF